ncbi:hypothetical protein Tco_1094504 [Tanacetum coccineum]|uniref:Uncharacterized protein n=1 Tax=Tanacetum coccineum TaxID=301880 RepID=A0ABQ5IFP4_9ASTR
MLAIPLHSQSISMAEIVSKEAQKKSKAGNCFRSPSHNKHTLFLSLQRSTSCKSKTSAINRAFYMVPLPSRDQRHTWLRYQVEGYGKDIVHNYEQRLETIWGRSVNWVHVLDFAGLTEEIRQTLGDRLRMVYIGDEGMSDTEMGLDVADTLCFQLGGARRRMTWRQFILGLGLHTEEEKAEARFGA